MKHEMPTFLVFSFNRGQFLRNCIASIERHACSSKVIIVDDLSDETDTKAALAQLSKKYSLIQPSLDSDKHKLGGLYPNMQTAVNSLPEDTLFCCLQDDMQLVRDITAEDVAGMRQYFEKNPKAGFLHHAFMKGEQRQRYIKHCEYMPERNAYQRITNDNKPGEYFSAVFCSITTRLREHDWAFQQGEHANNAAASAIFERMGYMKTPFAHWLPCVPSHRHKRKTWAIRLVEKRTGAGFYPFNTISEKGIQAFSQRDHSILPIAEDYLTTKPTAPIEPWIYHPLQGASRWVYLAHRLEVICTSIRR